MYKSALLFTLVALLGAGSGQLEDQISTNTDDLRFIYYETLDDYVSIDMKDANSLQSSNIQSSRSLVVTIDGFLSNTTSPLTSLLRESYIEAGAENLVVLDWSELSGSRQRIGYNGVANPVLLGAAYLKVLGNVERVGKRLGEFLEYVEETKGIPMKDMTIVGGSMGAHIAGAAGQYLKNKYGEVKVGRIVGLDPAGPMYSIQLDRSKRLYKGQALFVDIYHAAMGTMGDIVPDTGDINVYLNGGSNQPGCAQADLSGGGVCSHTYGFKLFNAAFKEDIKACPCTGLACTCKFCRHRCTNPIKLGPDFPQGARGRYYASYGAL